MVGPPVCSRLRRAVSFAVKFTAGFRFRWRLRPSSISASCSAFSSCPPSRHTSFPPPHFLIINCLPLRARIRTLNSPALNSEPGFFRVLRVLREGPCLEPPINCLTTYSRNRGAARNRMESPQFRQLRSNRFYLGCFPPPVRASAPAFANNWPSLRCSRMKRCKSTVPAVRTITSDSS